MEKAVLNLKNDYGFIVKMDITDLDNPDVKVYDFEGNEVAGGGGGGADLLTCDIKVVNHTGMVAAFIYQPDIKDGAITGEVTLPPLNNNDEANVKAYCYYDSPPFINVSALKTTTPPTPATMTASDAVNCSLDLADPSDPLVLVTESNASITITLS